MNLSQTGSIHIMGRPREDVVAHPDLESLSRDAAARFLAAMREAVEERGFFFAAMAGGKTPGRFHEILAQSRADWSKTHIFFSDERRVPWDHPDSNYRAVRESLLSKIGIPKTQVHRMPAESVNLRIAARNYEEELKRLVPSGSDGVPKLDWIGLGIGDDGHAASLFPGTFAVTEQKRLVMENYVDRLAAWRMTFTLPLINRARRVVFLVEGKPKAIAVAKIIRENDVRLPAAMIGAGPGAVSWILDLGAASQIKRKTES